MLFDYLTYLYATQTITEVPLIDIITLNFIFFFS